MTYPNITQYRDAMFDVEAFEKLRGLEAVKDSKGMPVFVAGNFAVVFKVIYKGRQYALKCFYRDVADRRKRYAAISDYLGALSSAYFADYTYYEEEVWISSLGMSYPVVLMEWIEGDTLGVYLSRLLGNGLNSVDANVRLEGVYRKFIELSVFLLGSDFAHGDLKHDNIIVTKEGELRLVDYDGMFVPALVGMSACELGGTAYQHPLRKSDFFDARLDDFSIFVISASLLALSLYPSMYSDYNSKDNLLFSRSDYSTLSESVVIKQMYNICDNRLNMLLDKIVAMISLAMPYSTNSLSLITSLQIKSPISPIEEAIPKENTTIVYTENLWNMDIEMILVEGGTFMMGSPEDEEGRSKDETLHKVKLDSFYIGKYQVTQEQWQAIMGNNLSYFEGYNRPVESVSWNNAQEFIKNLNTLTGKNYRLPTEAEWEYACRGGNKSKGYKYSGSDNIGEVAWYEYNSHEYNSMDGCYCCETFPVGYKKPNELGIYDMSGNVWECCNDWYNEDYYANSPEYNPKGQESGSERVLRGGSCLNYSQNCRSASRGNINPNSRFDQDIGFRLALDLILLDIEMIFVEGGTFMMGSPEDEEDRKEDETLHKVRLDSFHIGKYPITQKQWQTIMGNNPSRFKGDNRPVETISWVYAQEFINKLNQLTGKEYRLPTEAEWEYACRGGNKSKGYKYSGSDNIDEVAWHRDNSGNVTHPIGRKKPNELDIYDMSGNIWELCNDWRDQDYYKNSPEYNPKGPEGWGEWGYVLRGGCWKYFAWLCRSAYRSGTWGDSGDFGLRIALDFKIFNIEMIFVEGGTFMMGSPEDEEDRSKNETLHKVRLDSFYIGKYQVTQKQWEAIMGNNPSYFKGDTRPIEQVSWNDVQEFIKKLKEKTGMNYRLPTEAEWEYACRGGNKSKGYLYSGSDNIDEVAWYSGNFRDKTHYVGQKKPNELGIYDMTGNVWEWCNDWYNSDYYKNSPEYNPTGPASGSSRVRRGGSWYGDANCRSAYRSGDAPDFHFNYFGFRLVMDFNFLDIEMIFVEGGTFMMGSRPEDEKYRRYDETLHKVRLDSFYIGKYPITQKQWQAIMGNNPSGFQGNNHPVEWVSWDDAQEFIKKLNTKTEKNYRLPTEAEWEYACRGGNKSKGYKYSGSDNIDEVAWYGDCLGTHPVGQKKPNELGIYDMSGNVWEWCNDWYSEDYYANSPEYNPKGPESGSRRVFRGGSWYSFEEDCCSDNRHNIVGEYYESNSHHDYRSPNNRDSDYGLRLVMDF